MNTSSFSIKEVNIQFKEYLVKDIKISILVSIPNKMKFINFKMNGTDLFSKHNYEFMYRLEESSNFGIYYNIHSSISYHDSGQMVCTNYVSVEEKLLIKFLVDNEYITIINKNINNIYYQLKLTNDLLLKLLN